MEGEQEMDNKESNDSRLSEIIGQFDKEKKSLLPILQKVQEVDKYLSPESIKEISRFLGISENYIYSVATFYPQFSFETPAGHKVRVCTCNACHLLGAGDILEAVEAELNIKPGEKTADGVFSLEESALAGCSTMSPVMVVDKDIYGRMTPEKVKEVLGKYN